MNKGALLTSVILALAAVACSKEEDKKDDEKTDTASVTLPATYGTSCAGCHGAKGGGASEGASGPKLTGTTMTEAAFVAVVKDGRTAKGMPANLMVEADAKQSHKYFTAK